MVRTLDHSDFCKRFHLNSDKSMLAVGTGYASNNDNEGGVTVWSTADWKKIAEVKIGEIVDVKFNSGSNKILAVRRSGEISMVDIE